MCANCPFVDVDPQVLFDPLTCTWWICNQNVTDVAAVIYCQGW